MNDIDLQIALEEHDQGLVVLGQHAWHCPRCEEHAPEYRRNTDLYLLESCAMGEVVSDRYGHHRERVPGGWKSVIGEGSTVPSKDLLDLRPFRVVIRVRGG